MFPFEEPSENSYETVCRLNDSLWREMLNFARISNNYFIMYDLPGIEETMDWSEWAD